ncbi:hypothetical protein V6N12_028572 [Hibiscus sabdariffa]|uniref:Uncharacterized protein n=1 Tax=Hibiscus sabdariffa TaxID=183260 RepID=A0ABR2F683_9ROSI
MTDAHLSNHIQVSASSQLGASVMRLTSDPVVVVQPTANSSMYGDIAENLSPHVLEHVDSTAAHVDNNDEAHVDNNDELPAACDDSSTKATSPSQADNTTAPPTLN